ALRRSRLAAVSALRRDAHLAAGTQRRRRGKSTCGEGISLRLQKRFSLSPAFGAPTSQRYVAGERAGVRGTSGRSLLPLTPNPSPPIESVRKRRYFRGRGAVIHQDIRLGIASLGTRRWFCFNAVMNNVPHRYRKQVLFDPIGEEGQRKICGSQALVVGCGALGSVIADQLVRAGVGTVRIVDRDFVDITNLQRQVLYDEQDIADGLPKAIAAARKLQRVNSDVTIDAHVADVDHTNILKLV